MPCFNPLKAWRGRVASSNGRFPPVFNINDGYADRPLQLPCGQCVGCRLEHSRQWAVRMAHEASLNAANSFITLTYNDANLPPNKSLKFEDFQKFMKRLRQYNARKLGGKPFKFYHCGEYGEKLSRPHYHALLFGFDFPDRRHHSTNARGDHLFTSKILTEVWGKGHCLIGDLTFHSAAYCARYCTKKITGYAADFHYCRVDDNGNWYWIDPEYATMSNGLAKQWIETFTADVYPDDFVVMNGKKCRPPRYYDKYFDEHFPREMRSIRNKRIVNSKKHEENNTPERLKVRETVTRAKMSQFSRNYEV